MLTVTFVLSGISIILLLLPIASTIKLMNNSSDLKEKDIKQEAYLITRNMRFEAFDFSPNVKINDNALDTQEDVSAKESDSYRVSI